jgi:hypothetical protein
MSNKPNFDQQPGDEAAAKLKKRVGKCEMCGWADENQLECHEILRGVGLRRLARGVPCCCLILCNEWANDCHGMMSGKPWEWQLAILWRSRRDDHDLLHFWKIAGRRKPEVEELLGEVTK